MGYNTTLILCNDAFGDIKEDKDFGNKVVQAAGNHLGDKTSLINSLGNYGKVISMNHADNINVIIAGGNTGQLIHSVDDRYFDYSKQSAINLLINILEEAGYKVTKE